MTVAGIILFSAVILPGCGWREEIPGDWGSRFSWLSDPVEQRFPPADQALELPGFRVAGVHYWQGNWNYNFWTNLKVGRIDEDLRRIREHGFNTILLNLPWGYFQPAAFPPSYSQRAFEKLTAVMEAAAKRRLYVILRVGTHEMLPEGIQGRPYLASDLLLDERESEAYSDLFRETAKRSAGWDHLLFLFFSWEDISAHIIKSTRERESRLDYMRGAVVFHDYLRRVKLSHWNQLWQTNYGSLEEMPFPAYGSRAYGEFLKFADQRLMNGLLPTVAEAARRGSPDVRLSYEIRVDSAPIFSQGLEAEPDWFDHRHTWNLTPDYQVVSAYFNPYWGDSNQGGFVSAERAAERLNYLLDQIEESVVDKPVFFDQLNFVDSSPRFRLNSRLKGEEEIARFLELSLETLYHRSLGYAVWALRAFEVNSLYNSSFEDDLEGWETEDPNLLQVENEGERFLTLEPGSIIHQKSSLPLDFGDDPFDFRLMARSQDGGRLSIRFEVPHEWVWRVAAAEELSPTTSWKEYRARLSIAHNYRLTLESTGSTAVQVDELSLFNWVQRSSVLGQQGEMIGRRSEILRRTNRSWRQASGRIGLEAPWAWSQESLARAGHIYDDGWVSQQVTVPLLVPWFDAALALEIYVAEEHIWREGNSVRVDLEDRSLGQHDLVPGLNRLSLPLGEPLHPRQWMLRLSFERALLPREWDPSSPDQRKLSAKLLLARVEGRLPEERRWTGEVVSAGEENQVRVVVQVAGEGGSPLESTLVLGHAGGQVGADETDSRGQAVLRLALDRQPGRPTPLFIEVPASEAAIRSVEIK